MAEEKLLRALEEAGRGDIAASIIVQECGHPRKGQPGAWRIAVWACQPERSMSKTAASVRARGRSRGKGAASRRVSSGHGGSWPRDIDIVGPAQVDIGDFSRLPGPSGELSRQAVRGVAEDLVACSSAAMNMRAVSQRGLAKVGRSKLTP
ncbi:hypothetical protein NDU88_004322 [Pleurodeles waltl]|uniref:Uncharacterized protein n=1 Tax=Pleurodeles waltl TaxID=8319 RepID=A0AAV7WRJ4_PLEWA|nr:hypothetical protein NDU88_004322 [Pleurodeles waltl]